jgi:hypothetical protein
MLDAWQHFTGGLAARARRLQHQYDDPSSHENIGTLLLRELVTVRDPKMPRRRKSLRLADYIAPNVPPLSVDDRKAMKRQIPLSDWHVASTLREVVRYWYARRSAFIQD